MAHPNTVPLQRLGLLLVSMLLLLLSGCGDRPPLPTLKAGQQKLHIELGTYSWKFLAGQVTADAPGPFHLIDNATEIATLAPGTMLTIKFSHKPKTMTLQRWRGQEIVGREPLKSSTFRLPDEKGAYLYSIRAEWRQGSGEYAFGVNLQ